MVAPDVRARLKSSRGYVFDLDGTLVLGDKHNRGLQSLPGAVELLQLLASRGIPFGALTNGTARPPDQQGLELQKAGLQIPAQRIMTPATVAADYFSSRGFRTILVLGVEGVWKPLSDAGLEVIRPAQAGDPESADAVFVGWYREIHMDEIEAACKAIWSGAGLFAASLVPFFATRSGRALGSSRAISAMITSVTGRRATVLGKPSQHALKSAARRLGCKPAEVVVVGDQRDLEVRMANKGGALAVLVHTGISEAEATDERQDVPDLALSGVRELLELLR